MQHIIDELKTVYQEGLILDGELYSHGENFQTNMEMVGKYTEGESEKMKFHIYDTVINREFEWRNKFVKQFFKENKFEHLEEVPTFIVEVEKNISHLHAEMCGLGYEGLMIRWGIDDYKLNSRSVQLLKYKDFIDIACEIIAIGPADRRPTWGRPEVKWVKPDGTEVEFACKVIEFLMVC